MKAYLITAALLLGAVAFSGPAEAKIPFFNAVCPGKIDVHADAGGPVFLNGKEGKLHISNESYFEAKHDGVTVSVAVNPDGTLIVSYTGKGGANGICTVK